ncbi:hypothetical protein GCM10010168_86280 [Actinoplanes ianthinogenes]|uniref:Uncharacterized protein n=1 Tax=Actinoplanes ianthinogenes TaxID=122358 RepID=A0ABN6CK38_9ACTN|nr:hypothetical protein [Actinoplanes ianthinogenes]BCJ45359.1 hypothetical protein Aiant_60160 [Actinoplanes ianthinogenes]GGR54001.1 hypothetical protein GCM10010168_86280 [Actinoplanes ianthinogenes]
MKARPIYVCRFGCPGHRRIRPGRWAWWITDGPTGPVAAEGTTRTERGALRQLDRALSRVQLAVGDHVCRRPILHPLDVFEAAKLTARLEADGVPVTVQVPVDGQVVLFPALELTTAQEAHTYRLVARETDAPVRWAGVA